MRMLRVCSVLLAVGCLVAILPEVCHAGRPIEEVRHVQPQRVAHTLTMGGGLHSSPFHMQTLGDLRPMGVQALSSACECGCAEGDVPTWRIPAKADAQYAAASLRGRRRARDNPESRRQTLR